MPGISTFDYQWRGEEEVAIRSYGQIDETAYTKEDLTLATLLGLLIPIWDIGFGRPEILLISIPKAFIVAAISLRILNALRSRITLAATSRPSLIIDKIWVQAERYSNIFFQ